MVDKLHRVAMKSASVDSVYAALTTLGGLSGCWATDTQGRPEVGETLEFRFEPGGFETRRTLPGACSGKSPTAPPNGSARQRDGTPAACQHRIPTPDT